MTTNPTIKSKQYETKYRKARIDRHNAVVNNFLDNAIADKKSITRAIHELLDREAQLEAKLRQNEQDKFTEVQRICEVLFKNMLPDYRAGQLTLWMAAFNRRFIKKDPEFNMQNVFNAIDEIDQDNAYILIRNAKPIKSH
jgi:hypothetical protein